MKARVVSGEAVLGVFDLLEGGYVVGSSPASHLHIDSPAVAARHVRLKVEADGVVVEDLGSGYETSVNGAPVSGSQWAAAGSTIGLGTVSIEILEEEEPASHVRYEVGDVVAQGAMGVIRSARELSTGREVAMKQMHEELAARDPGLAARFVQEARITAHLEHPNIVPVHDVSPGTEAERFYTMKLVRGISLEEILEQLATGSEVALAAYPLETLLTIFQKACDAVAFAHSKGVIHRDLKPANIMVGEYGEVMVMDWGLAKLLGEAAAELVQGHPEVFAGTGAGLTLAGTVMGTPHYMAPEQAGSDGEMVDDRSDVYALGAILYRMLTLRTPIEGETAHEVLAGARQGRIVAPVERVGAALLPHLPGGRIPASLAAVAMKALALAPARRYQSVPELQADVRAYQSGFATGAERAGALRQLALLIKRHRGVATATAASLVLIAGLCAFFLTKLIGERDRAQASESRAVANENAARNSEEKERQARIEADANARLAEGRLAEVKETAARLEREAEARRVAEEQQRKELEGKLLAQSETARTQEQLEMEKRSSETAKQEAENADRAKTAAEAKAKTKASERIAKLPAEAHAAALRGDAGTVLLNSVFLLGPETDPRQKLLHQRRIGVALRQMPRLLYLQSGAHSGRVSRDGKRAVFFSGDKGTLFDPATLQSIGPSLDHGPNGWIEAVEFGRDSDYLLSAGSTTNAPRRIDPMRRQIRGQFFSAGSTTADQPKVWVWSAINGSRVTLPERRLEGNLEGFLPYPDRLRVLTVHGGVEGRNRQVTLWTLTGSPRGVGESLPASAGYLAALIPGTERSRFHVQSFAPGVGAGDGAIRQLDLSTTTLRISAPLRGSSLEGAAAISPDGERVLRLVNRQLRFAEAPPPDATGRSTGPQVLAYLKDGTGSGVPLSALSGEPQELINVSNGKVLGRTVHGGAATFSPDSAWLLVADGEKAHLHSALNNDPASESTDETPGRITSLAFSGDSSKAIVVREGGRVSFLQPLGGRRSCPHLLLPAEVAEVSTSASARLTVATGGGGVSLWETTPPESRRPRVNFRALSAYAVWVSGDGRWAISIPPSSVPSVAPGTGLPVVVQPAGGASTGALLLHDLSKPRERGSHVMRLNELPVGGTCWLTRNGRFFLTWGGGGGAKCWDLTKRSKDRDLISVNEARPDYRPKKYGHFYAGPGIVVAEGPDDVFGLVAEGRRVDDKLLTAVFRDGKAEKDLPDDSAPEHIVVKDSAGCRRVADLDGKQTLAGAAKALGRPLPPDARRAFFSEDRRLVAVLCTSASEPATREPVLSELLVQSDAIGKTVAELDRDGRHYGFAAPAGRAWRLYVYDVPAGGVALLGDVPLPGLTAFRWEGERCVALSNTGEWTEIDFSPDRRPIEDLSLVSLVLTGRAIDPDTGEVAMNAQPISTLVRHRQQLLQKYSAGWQTGTK